MENVKKRYKIFRKALTALTLLHSSQYEEIYKSLQDSFIQRFEFTIDTFWKFLKFYLVEKEKVDIKTGSPRAIIKIALDADLISKNNMMY